MEISNAEDVDLNKILTSGCQVHLGRCILLHRSHSWTYPGLGRHSWLGSLDAIIILQIIKSLNQKFAQTKKKDTKLCSNMITDICKNLNTAQQVLYIWNFVLLGVFTHPTTPDYTGILMIKFMDKLSFQRQYFYLMISWLHQGYWHFIRLASLSQSLA